MRFPDWPERLAAYLARQAPVPFAWGTQDCVTFAFGAVAALTGIDHLAAYRGRYDSARGAAAFLLAYGGGAADGVALPPPAQLELEHFDALLLDAVRTRLGPPLASPLLAQRGDVAIFPQPEGATLGVVLGGDVAIVTPAGLRHVPLRTCSAAWRV